MQNSAPSSLVKNIARFSHCLAGIGMIYLAPQIARYLRPEMFSYLSTEFSYDIALWGSWGFVMLVMFCGFFGASVLLQLLTFAVIRKKPSNPRF